MSQKKSFITIGHYRYSEADQLGTGYESVVYKAYHSLKKIQVALKIIDLTKIEEGIFTKLLQSQLLALQALKGMPNVINMHQIIKTEKFIYVATELCKGDLANQIKNKFSQIQAWSKMRQLIIGYKSLYEKGIVHRDIKPENIFVRQTGVIKIGDFGFATNLEQAKRQSFYNIGSPSYMAPQVLSRNQYSHSSDIWAIGVTFYELLTGNVPWICDTQQQIQKQLTKESIQKKIQKIKASEEAKNFLRKALTYQYYYRMKPEELFQYKSIRPNNDKMSKSMIIANDNLSITTAQTPKYQRKQNKDFYFQSSKVSNKTRTTIDSITDQIYKKHPQSVRNTAQNNQKTRRFSFDTNLLSAQKEQLKMPKRLQEPAAVSQNLLGNNIITQTAFKKKHRTSFDVVHNKQLNTQINICNVQSIDKIINGYLQSCKLAYNFIQNSLKIKQSSEWQTELNLFRVCLKNFVINTIEKIKNIERSDLLENVCSEQAKKLYLKSSYYALTKIIGKDAYQFYENNNELRKHWKIARQQKPKSLMNTAICLLNAIKKTFKKSNVQNDMDLLQIGDILCQLIQIFNNFCKSKYISSQFTSNKLRTRKKMLTNQKFMKRMAQIQNMK